MKKFTILSLILFYFFLMFGSCIAQEDTKKTNRYFSAEIFWAYPAYFISPVNKFNYGFGGAVSDNLRPFKVSLGLFYNTYKHDVLYPPGYNNFINKESYSVDYFNIPFLIGVPLIKKEIRKSQFLITTGLIFNIPQNYHETIYYNNLPPKKETPGSHYNFGNSIRLGFQYDKSLSNAINVFIRVCVDYKFLLDNIDLTNTQHSDSQSYYEGYRLFAGINLGVEWNHNKH